MEPEQLISCALDIGEQMLLSGAEVGRVETSVRLICTAYGCKRADVFSITSSIILSIEDASGRHCTQTRRINGSQTDLTKLDRLNSLSRELCAETPDYAYVQRKLRAICQARTFPLWAEALASALIAGSFALFFGGSAIDGLAAAILGLITRYVTFLSKKAGLNPVFANVAAAFVLSLLAALLVRLGIGQDPDRMLIGAIMLLIPTVSLTNSLRDMISGDIMTGLLRFFDAVLVAAAIAAGYILAAQLLGGAL